MSGLRCTQLVSADFFNGLLGTTGEIPRGVYLKDSFAVVSVSRVSNFRSGIIAIDTRDPLSLVVEDTRGFVHGTWSEPFVANGLVYSGFRFGSPVTTELLRIRDEFQFGQTSALTSGSIPNYHWRGWGRVEKNGPSGPESYILMSDALTSASLGGLYIYNENTQSVASVLGQISGEEIVIDSTTNWCFQIDNGDRSSGQGGAGAEQQSIRSWDISDPTDPQLVGRANTGAWADAGSARGLVFDATENYLFVAGGEYGLRVVDVSDPANPSFVPGSTRCGLNQPNKHVRGLLLYKPTVLAVTTIENSLSRVTLWDVSDPTSPRKLSDVTPPGITRITDLDMRFGRVYATVVAGGVPQLQVWY